MFSSHHLDGTFLTSIVSRTNTHAVAREVGHTGITSPEIRALDWKTLNLFE